MEIGRSINGIVEIHNEIIKILVPQMDSIDGDP